MRSGTSISRHKFVGGSPTEKRGTLMPTQTVTIRATSSQLWLTTQILLVALLTGCAAKKPIHAAPQSACTAVAINAKTQEGSYICHTGSARYIMTLKRIP